MTFFKKCLNLSLKTRLHPLILKALEKFFIGQIFSRVEGWQSPILLEFVKIAQIHACHAKDRNSLVRFPKMRGKRDLDKENLKKVATFLPNRY